MSGYRWRAMIKTVPSNGPEEVFDLKTLLTDGNGPLRCIPRYQDLADEHETLNRTLRRVEFGMRPEVRMHFEIMTMADQAHLATIVERLMRPDYDVQLSLDQGLTYRSVVLSRIPDPQALRGKTIAGAELELGLRCKSPIDRIPALLSEPDGQAQMLANEGLDAWSAGSPVSWTRHQTNGTVVEDTAQERSGVSCAKCEISAGGPVVGLSQPVSLVSPGLWAEVGVYMKAAVAETNAFGIRVRNDTQSKDISSDAETWATNQFGLTGNLSTAYELKSLRFRIDPSFNAGDAYTVHLNLLGSIGLIAYLDDAYLLYPVLPPEVARW